MRFELENLFLDISDNTGILTLNASHSNKMTQEFFEDFSMAISECEKHNMMGLIISGGRHFSTGADVDQLQQMIKSQSVVEEKGDCDIIPPGHLRDKNTFMKLHSMKYPVISAIGGFCIGSGCEIALNSHFRICEKNLKMGLPESTFGLLPALGGCVRSTQISGISGAIEIVFSGDLFSADDAARLGLADIITEKKESLNTALLFLEYINSHGEYDKSLKNIYLKQFLEER